MRRARSETSVWRGGGAVPRVGACFVVVLVASYVCAAAPRAEAAEPAPLTSIEQAAALSLAARAQGTEGRFDACAAMYHEAYRLDPATLGYLYSAARCEQKAGRWAKAREHYEAVLAVAPKGEEIEQRARQHLAEVRDTEARLERDRQREEAARQRQAEVAKQRADAARRLAAAQRGAAKTPAASVVRRVDDAQWRRRAGWTGVAFGVAAFGAGAWMMHEGNARLDELARKLERRDANDKIVGVGYDEAEAEQERAHGRIGLGGVLLGAGLLSGGVGAWMVWTSPSERVSLRPIHRGRGVELTMRF